MGFQVVVPLVRALFTYSRLSFPPISLPPSRASLIIPTGWP